MNSWRLKIRFWGVRGSLPTPLRENLGFGGNTACVQIESATGETLIFDAGSGIRELGDCMIRESGNKPLDIHLFMSHFHWDHVLGLPFFAPIFDPKNVVTINSSPYSAPLKPAMRGVLSAPYFPVEFDALPSHVSLREVPPSGRHVGSTKVTPFPVGHPQGACGYRVEAAGAAAIYVPDREPGNQELDRVILDYCQGADVLIHDGQYTPEEYRAHQGWGHGDWKEAARVAGAAQVKRLILFHHDPAHSDEVVSGIVEQTRSLFPSTEAAREGWTIEV
jgi:phosphoribosyl 1,2-cyclic phosphodiesterase